jgi:hypothetical protein
MLSASQLQNIINNAHQTSKMLVKSSGIGNAAKSVEKKVSNTGNQENNDPNDSSIMRNQKKKGRKEGHSQSDEGLVSEAHG